MNDEWWLIYKALLREHFNLIECMVFKERGNEMSMVFMLYFIIWCEEKGFKKNRVCILCTASSVKDRWLLVYLLQSTFMVTS